MLLTFAGEDYDDVVNLIFLRARYYSPSLKRFISEDDFPGIPTVPISLNRYIYCHNSPISYVDPTGHIVWIPIVLILIGGGISVAAYHYFTPPEKRSLMGYVAAFGIGIAATGLGMIAGQFAVTVATQLGLSAALSQTIGGIASGAVSAGFSRAAFNYLEGRPILENVGTDTAIGAGMGGLVPNLPGLRYRGPAPKLSWKYGWLSPLGGYVGPNTYRYLQRQILSKIESKFASILLTRGITREIFVTWPPSGTLPGPFWKP